MPGQMFGGLNTIVPLIEASGNMRVKYSRNPKSYPLMQYTGLVNADLPRGAYLQYNPNDTIRVKPPTEWPYGTPAPAGFDNLQGATVQNFFCKRYAFTTTLDKTAVNVASFDVQADHSERLAQDAMINRTKEVCSLITTSANYAASHVTTATALGGAFADTGTTANPVLFKILSQAAQIILRDTGSRVRIGELGLLINANSAVKLAVSREIQEYTMQQVDSIKNLRGDEGPYVGSDSYLLPDKFRKFNIVVEDAYVNTANRESVADAAGTANVPCFPDNTALVFVRQGGLEKTRGAEGYSSFTQFVFEDMKAEMQDVEWDRLVHLRVVDNFAPAITSPASTVLITNMFS